MLAIRPSAMLALCIVHVIASLLPQIPPSVNWSAEAIRRVNNRMNLSYLQCVFHSQRLLQANRNHSLMTFMGSDGNRTDDNSYPTTLMRNPCEFQIAQRHHVFEGIDQLLLVGDSTIMRAYMHIVHADDFNYTTRVAELKDEDLNATLVLEGGAVLRVRFFRMLYVSTATFVLDRVFSYATRNSLIVFSLGPHDTSWLVFRKAMPGFRKAGIGVWAEAKKYWDWFAPRVAMYTARKLAELDEVAPPTAAFRRPVVVFRDMYLPNCNHPKYSKYPHTTRCKDLLVPWVLPHYRQTMRAMLALHNIPTVNMDALFPPCYLIDAGHIVRWCKNVEIQLFIQAYRATRRYNIQQGARNTSNPVPGYKDELDSLGISRKEFEAAIHAVPSGYDKSANISLYLTGRNLSQGDRNRILRDPEALAVLLRFSDPEYATGEVFSTNSTFRYDGVDQDVPPSMVPYYYGPIRLPELQAATRRHLLRLQEPVQSTSTEVVFYAVSLVCLCAGVFVKSDMCWRKYRRQQANSPLLS